MEVKIDERLKDNAIAARNEFMKLSAPFFEMIKQKIINSVPKYRLNADGDFNTIYDQKTQNFIDKCQKEIYDILEMTERKLEKCKSTAALQRYEDVKL